LLFFYDVDKFKNEIKAFFLGGRERLAVHRSGQGLFLPHARFKTKGESKLWSCCILHSSDLYAEKNKMDLSRYSRTVSPPPQGSEKIEENR